MGGINFSKFGKVGAPLARAGTHGLTQGGFSALRGGNFWHGFASRSIGSLASTSSQGIDSFGAKVAISSAAGGAPSAVAGGSFTDGAVTGAYVYLFNHHAHQIETNARIKKENRKNGSGALVYQNRSGERSGGTSSEYLLAKLYAHFQIGGGKPFNLDATTLDFSNTNQAELGLTDLKVGDDPKLVNLFNAGINSNSLAFGRIEVIRRSETEFSVINNRFDFTPLYDSNASHGRNAGNIVGAAVNYNLWLSPASALLPIIFGGGFDVMFNGNVTIPK